MRAITTLGLALVACIGVSASAEAYDYDQRWIRRTIGPPHRHSQSIAQHEHRFHSRQLYRKRVARPRHRHYHRDDDRSYSYRGRQEPALTIIEDRRGSWREDHREDRRGDKRGSRVYGYINRSRQTTLRDATSHVECFPPVESLSAEFLTEDGAMNDARLAWANSVRWRYGERYMSIDNAARVEKQCNISTSSESSAGKIVEKVGQAIGMEGHKIRCRLMASPCMAPIEFDPAIKGSK